jgi:hypothetical protein
MASSLGVERRAERIGRRNRGTSVRAARERAVLGNSVAELDAGKNPREPPRGEERVHALAVADALG